MGNCGIQCYEECYEEGVPEGQGQGQAIDEDSGGKEVDQETADILESLEKEKDPSKRARLVYKREVRRANKSATILQKVFRGYMCRKVWQRIWRQMQMQKQKQKQEAGGIRPEKEAARPEGGSSLGSNAGQSATGKDVLPRRKPHAKPGPAIRGRAREGQAGFICPGCRKGMSSSQHLTQHVSKYHPGLMQTPPRMAGDVKAPQRMPLATIDSNSSSDGDGDPTIAKKRGNGKKFACYAQWP